MQNTFQSNLVTGNTFPINGNNTTISIPTSITVNVCGNNLTVVGPIPEDVGFQCTGSAVSESTIAQGVNSTEGASSASAATAQNVAGNVSSTGSGASAGSASGGGNANSASAAAGAGASSSAGGGFKNKRDEGIQMLYEGKEDGFYHFTAPAGINIKVCGQMVGAVQGNMEIDCDREIDNDDCEDDHHAVYFWYS